MERKRVHVLIRGRVQGVFFRASTQDMAHRLRLSGYVRNLPDGRVEAVFEGARDKLKQAVQWCHSGPAGASVYETDEKWLAYTGEFDGFEIRY
jgi:acylphosphatase